MALSSRFTRLMCGEEKVNIVNNVTLHVAFKPSSFLLVNTVPANKNIC